MEKRKDEKEKENLNTKTVYRGRLELTSSEFENGELFVLEPPPTQSEEHMQRIAAASLPEEELPSNKKIPERNLLSAMIERAILDLRQPDQLTRKSAEKWIFERFTYPCRIFSIYWCLEWLDMEGVLTKLRVDCQELIKGKLAQIEEGKESPEARELAAKWAKHFGHASPQAMWKI